MSIRLDLRFLVIVLLAVIIGMLAVWQPWQGLTKRTITVTGEGTISAAPDEFIFNPVYEKKAASSEEALSESSKIGNAVIAKLKELGLQDADLKTTVTTNPSYEPYPVDSGSEQSRIAPIPPVKTKEYVSTYSVTATVHDAKVAQAVLDYIATTPVLYSVTPQSTFTKETRKKLESEARAKGLQDAREKASQSASELGSKVGKLVSVSDLNQYSGPIFLEGKVAPSMARDTATTTVPTLETGTQDLSFSVTVVYHIK